MFITIQQWLYNVIFRLASSKDSTNLSYKKKTEETVGVTLTAKVIKMIEDFYQVNRTQVTIYLKSILDIVYKKPWILLRLLLCTFNNDHVTYYVFIIAWTFHLHCLWIYYSITFRVIFSQRIILQLLNRYKNTKASTYSREKSPEDILKVHLNWNYVGEANNSPGEDLDFSPCVCALVKLILPNRQWLIPNSSLRIVWNMFSRNI